MAVVAVVLISGSEGIIRRAAGPAATESTKTAGSDPKKESWIPVREAKEFNVNVADGIEGANQIRHEKWDKGTMTGMYAQPLADKKWQITNYVADDKGYHITS